MGILATGKESMACCGQLMERTQLDTQQSDNVTPMVTKSFPGVNIKVISHLDLNRNLQSIETVEVQTKRNLFRIFLNTADSRLSNFDITDLT